jgi:nitrile hydratase accessory protein
MQTRFEHYAATSMLGDPDAPPRCDGALAFEHEWERRAFGIGLSLSKEGYFEWEDFRKLLIAEIASWEATHALNDPSWHYYSCWLAALEKVLAQAGILGEQR